VTVSAAAAGSESALLLVFVGGVTAVNDSDPTVFGRSLTTQSQV